MQLDYPHMASNHFFVAVLYMFIIYISSIKLSTNKKQHGKQNFQAFLSSHLDKLNDEVKSSCCPMNVASCMEARKRFVLVCKCSWGRTKAERRTMRPDCASCKKASVRPQKSKCGEKSLFCHPGRSCSFFYRR